MKGMQKGSREGKKMPMQKGGGKGKDSGKGKGC